MSNTTKPNEEKVEELKKRLEEKGMEDVIELKKKEGIIPTEQGLIGLMQKGADEFEKEIGRKMSYGEMREMYG